MAAAQPGDVVSLRGAGRVMAAARRGGTGPAGENGRAAARGPRRKRVWRPVWQRGVVGSVQEGEPGRDRGQPALAPGRPEVVSWREGRRRGRPGPAALVAPLGLSPCLRPGPGLPACLPACLRGGRGPVLARCLRGGQTPSSGRGAPRGRWQQGWLGAACESRSSRTPGLQSRLFGGELRPGSGGSLF